MHIVALSGGKDSTAMALRLRELHPDVPYRFIITPTGNELPTMDAHWAKLDDDEPEESCRVCRM
jgi:predicted PP-loop superfamily ATPase